MSEQYRYNIRPLQVDSLFRSTLPSTFQPDFQRKKKEEFIKGQAYSWCLARSVSPGSSKSYLKKTQTAVGKILLFNSNKIWGNIPADTKHNIYAAFMLQGLC